MIRKLTIFIIIFIISNFLSGYNIFASKVKVGSFAIYRVTDSTGKKNTVKYSILKKSKQGYWIEYVTKSKDKEKVVTKLLVDKIGKGESKIIKMIIQTGDEPAREIPAAMLKMAPQTGDWNIFQNYDYRIKEIENYKNKYENDKIKIVKKNNVTVKTKAGIFKAVYIKEYEKKDKNVTEYYIVKNIPTGIVKIVSNGETIVELLKYKKSGAKSEIKGKIKKFNIPGFPFRNE